MQWQPTWVPGRLSREALPGQRRQIGFELLEGRWLLAPFTAGNIVVSNSPITDGVPTLYEYTIDGRRVQEWEIPNLDGSSRDLAVDDDGLAWIFNGTFQPWLSRFDPSSGTFAHSQFTGWSTVNNLTFGGVAVDDEFVFLTDDRTGNDTSFERGIVRYNKRTGEFNRFHPDHGDIIDITIGLDGKLYTLGPSDSPIGSTIRQYDPQSMELLRTITPPRTHRALAVAANGDIFAANPLIFHYDPDGNQLSEPLDTRGVNGLSDIDIDIDGRLVAASHGGEIVVTTVNFDGVISFNTRASNGYSFAGWVAPSRGLPMAEWDNITVPTTGANSILDVLANDVGSPTGGALTIVAVGPTSNDGVVTIDEGSVLSYTPAAEFVGSETLTYTVSDGQGNTDVGLVTVRVISSGGPHVTEDAYETIEDQILVVDAVSGLLSNDQDVDIFSVFGEGNILVTAVPTTLLQSTMVYEYTPAGDLVRAINWDDFEHQDDGGSRDLVFDALGKLDVFDGTFNPRLTTYNPRTGRFTQSSHAGWSTISNQTYGGAAAFDEYVFVTDNVTGGQSNTEQGIIRFNLHTLEGERFELDDGDLESLHDENFIDVAVGLDGFLYTLGPALTLGGTELRKYDPRTMESLGEVKLSLENRAVAIDAEGQIYAVNFNDDTIYKYAATGGSPVQTYDTGYGAEGGFGDIDISSDGTRLLVSAHGLFQPPYVAMINSDFSGDPSDFQFGDGQVLANTFTAWIQPPVGLTLGETVALPNSDPGHGEVTVTADGSFIYEPEPDFAGIDTFTYRVQASNGVFNIGTVSIEVHQVNDAPVLTPQHATLGQVALGGAFDASLRSFINAGPPATTIIDVDPDATPGAIAVVAADGPGTWWFRLPGMAQHQMLGAVSDTTALLLPRDADIRFISEGELGGSGTLTFRAWDESAGDPGTYADCSQSGGQTAFSDASDTVTVEVTASLFTVTGVELNMSFADPLDLPSGPQPTSWSSQRSDVRSITLRLDTPAVVAVEDLRLTNLGINAPQEQDTEITIRSDQLTIDGQVLTIEFSGGELPDGVYSLELLSTARGEGGELLDGNGDGVGGDSYRIVGDPENRLYKQIGDWNGDAGTTIFDFPVFAYWFGLSVGPADAAPDYADLNRDGAVTIFDFPKFQQHFGDELVFSLNPPQFGIIGADISVERGWSDNASRSGDLCVQRCAAQRFSMSARHDLALLLLLNERYHAKPISIRRIGMGTSPDDEGLCIDPLMALGVRSGEQIEVDRIIFPPI